MSAPKKNGVGGADRAEPGPWSEASADVERAKVLIARVEAPKPRINARARVFAKIEATRRANARGSQTWIWAVSGAAAGALAVLIALRVLAPASSKTVIVEQRTAEIVALAGNVHAGERAQPMAIARVGQRVRSGARVKTNVDSASVLRVLGVGDLELAAETEVALILDELDRGRGVELALNAGSLVANVEVQPVSRTIAVTSGPWTVRVVGTIFRVLRDGADDIEVDVTRGSVEVDGPETHLTLGAGERFSSREARAKARQRLQTVQREAEGSQLSELREPSEKASAGDSADREQSTKARVAKTLRAAAKQSRAERDAKARDQAETREHADGAASNRTERDATARNQAETREREGTASQRDANARNQAEIREHADGAASNRTERDATARNPSEASQLGAESSIGPERLAPTAEALYERAQSETNPLRAIALFDQVATQAHPLAEIAAHQAARITMRIGKCTEALTRFDQLLTRYPTTAYAQEARLNILECHIRLGELQLAKKTLETFLQKHPTSERSPELRFLRAELHREKGDYRAAARDYESAIGSRRDEDARYFQGWCQLQIGQTADATTTLGNYLDRYAQGRHAHHARQALKKLSER